MALAYGVGEGEVGCSCASDTDKCDIYLEDPRLDGSAELRKFLLAQSSECAV